MSRRVVILATILVALAGLIAFLPESGSTRMTFSPTTWVTLCGVFLAYFIPTFVALGRRALNPNPTFLVNLFFGLTVLGWVVALVMGAGARSRAEVEAEKPRVGPTKTCPRCAEQVQPTALVCRYCGHDFAKASEVPVSG